MAAQPNGNNMTLTDYDQGVKAACRVRFRAAMDVSNDEFPETPVTVNNTIDYLRGCFEGGGAFDEGAVSLYNAPLVTDILDKLGIAYTRNLGVEALTLPHANAYDLLGQIYGGSFPAKHNHITAKYMQYVDHVGGFIKCKVWRTDPDAVVPFKTRPSDVGYDLVAIKKHKQLTNTTVLLDTGIKIQVELGYYAEIVPRSSISKTGYMLANNTGIIDPGYTGNLYIALIKVDQSAPDIELPFRGCQLIIRKQHHAQIEVMDDVSELASTGRGEGGFGSTGN